MPLLDANRNQETLRTEGEEEHWGRGNPKREVRQMMDRGLEKGRKKVRGE